MVLQQRLQDLQILKSTATGNFRVLVPATVPTSPVSPKPAARRAARLRRRPARRHRPGLPAGAVRHAAPHHGRDRHGPARAHPRTHPAHQQARARREHPGHAHASRRSRRRGVPHGAHQPRLHERGRRTSRSVLITSCVQGEGKSVAVANLAVSMALAGKKVVVVDADLRRPRQHTYFGLDNEVGLSTVITGQTNLSQSLHASRAAGRRAGPSGDRLRGLVARRRRDVATLRAHQRPDPAEPRRDRRRQALRGHHRASRARGGPRDRGHAGHAARGRRLGGGQERGRPSLPGGHAPRQAPTARPGRRPAAPPALPPRRHRWCAPTATAATATATTGRASTISTATMATRHARPPRTAPRPGAAPTDKTPQG